VECTGTPATARRGQSGFRRPGAEGADGLPAKAQGHPGSGVSPGVGGGWLKTSGTWEEVFGQSKVTDGIFMAWNYARYIGRVAEAGKAEYPLPSS